ncbi:MAG: bifunctional glycosyltransferase family 2/GtrA family protein [Eubacteriales bacterium]|nr:bifunctional glycosyltransferase family 2/GtrA family protein [Eubacteriales bacterium]
MALDPKSAVILIPSLEPDDRLPAYLGQLRERGFERMVVVDDGSSEKTQHLFDQMAQMEGVTVLHHDVNHGKGVALKTGYTWIRDNLPDISGVITADADGQHTVEDCWRLAEALSEGKRALYLGSRDFNLPNVPARSRKGNKITSAVFWALYGQYLPDTQTGLRAFRREELSFMIDVSGERYEYEMNVLIACAQASIPMIPLTIETVYENDNAGSHFHPVRDSIRIYKVILGNFIKFMGASIASFLIDQGVFALMEFVVLSRVGWAAASIQGLSTLVARLVSAPCNFLMNRAFVFRFKQNTAITALKYAALAITLLVLSWLGVALLGVLGMPRFLDNLSKLIIDTLLYFLSYRVQNKWIFREDKA